MKNDKGIPKELIDGGSMPAARGYINGSWYQEEDLDATRLGIRIRSKLHEEQTRYQKITVLETSFFGKMLTIDDIIMFTERDEFVYHEMLTHLPLCSLPDPRAVLIIGGGDCGCLREVLKHPTVRRVVQVDIDEQVTRVCQDFFPWVEPAIGDSRAELVFGDGVEYLSGREQEFDLVIVDSTDPVGPGLRLFLSDFYRKVAAALKPKGVMAAQTECPHWQPGMVAAIYDQIREAFELVTAYHGTVPTYTGSHWTWSYASRQRRHDDYFDAERAGGLKDSCLYYNPAIQQAAFSLPNFVRRVMSGDNPFARFDHQHQKQVSTGGDEG